MREANKADEHVHDSCGCGPVTERLRYKFWIVKINWGYTEQDVPPEEIEALLV